MMNHTGNVGYLDLQVNGYGGVDFNADDLSADSLNQACVRLDQDNVAGLLVTLITDDIGRMSARLTELVRLIQEDPLAQRLIRGFHIEGPFINSRPGYVGAHQVGAVRPANLDDMKRLLDSAAGLAKIVTLAPECDEHLLVTKMLAQQGVIVSAGHCNPSLDQLDAAIDAGLSMFTHLGNGCPLKMHRHDNIIQRVLSRADRLNIGLIADGVHVPWMALSNYLKTAGIERCFVVTDAISAAGMGAGQYQLAGQDVIVDDDGGTWAADRSHLVGSAGTMPMAEQKLKHRLGLSDTDVAQLLFHNAASLLGIHG